MSISSAPVVSAGAFFFHFFRVIGQVQGGMWTTPFGPSAGRHLLCQEVPHKVRSKQRSLSRTRSTHEHSQIQLEKQNTAECGKHLSSQHSTVRCAAERNCILPDGFNVSRREEGRRVNLWWYGRQSSRYRLLRLHCRQPWCCSPIEAWRHNYCHEPRGRRGT